MVENPDMRLGEVRFTLVPYMAGQDKPLLLAEPGQWMWSTRQVSRLGV